MQNSNFGNRRSQSPDRLNLESPLKRQKLDTYFKTLTAEDQQKLKTLDQLLGPTGTCMICERNISKSVKVRDMSTGSKEPIIFCLECLMKGKTKEGLDHQATCDYFIYDSLKYPLLDKEWTAEETLHLMQGIMKCGMGNWPDIATQFVKTKNETQCEKFYMANIYIPFSESTPFEHVTDKRATETEQTHKFYEHICNKIQVQNDVFEKIVRTFKQQEDQEFNLSGPENNQTNFVDSFDAQGLRLPKNNQRRETNAKISCQDVLGYQPKRGDFDQEYDMDAELLLADMEFNDDDTPDNIKLKENVIELYTARLDERIRRKKFVIERGLLDLKNVQRSERKYTKEEREIVNKCKIFARFHSKEEHERFVNGLLKERLIRQAIEQLNYFRAKGLTSLDQIEKFIESNKQKSKQMHNEKAFNNSAGMSKKNNEKLNGQWTDESLHELQKTLRKTDTEILSGKPALKGQGRTFTLTPHLNDPKWPSLSIKERAFVTEVNMKPSSYCEIKHKIQLEMCKNKKIREILKVDNIQKELPNEDLQRIQLVYDFVVRVKLISVN